MVAPSGPFVNGGAYTKTGYWHFDESEDYTPSCPPQPQGVHAGVRLR